MPGPRKHGQVKPKPAKKPAQRRVYDPMKRSWHPPPWMTSYLAMLGGNLTPGAILATAPTEDQKMIRAKILLLTQLKQRGMLRDVEPDAK